MLLPPSPGGRGGIPACLACFQAHTQGGSLGGSGQGGVSRPTPKGEVEGIWSGGLQATPKGEAEGDLARGGLQAHTQEVCSWGVSAPGGCLLLEGAWSLEGDPPGTATVTGGTHPIGMHSCYICVICPHSVIRESKTPLKHFKT